MVSGGRAERGEREVLVEDVLGVVGGLQLAEPGEGAAGKGFMQALRALVRFEAQAEAVQVRATLVPVGVETAGVPAHRGNVEVLVTVRVGGSVRVDVVDRAADRAGRDPPRPPARIAPPGPPPLPSPAAMPSFSSGPRCAARPLRSSGSACPP